MALARAALESMIARQAAVRISPEWLKELRGIAAEMREATREGSIKRLIALNESFHEAVHAASGCNYLQRLLAGQLVYDKAARRFLMGDPAERKRALEEHLNILAALEANDEDRAERAMRDHVLRSGRQHVAAAFARREE
jgi:DNA-binding GntR family transcriptional regulator